jgi:drug/metabolite transporter (DMT)-like permease
MRGVAVRSRRSRGILAVSATTVAWGLVPLVLKETSMPPLGFATYRLWFGVLVYGCALLATGRRPRWATLRGCALGGVLFATDISLTFTAFRLTTVANATIIGALAPVLIALGAARWFGERFSRRDVPFMVASFVGVVVVAAGSTGSASWSLVGDVCAALSTVSWSAYWLFSKHARRDVPTLEYMACVMLVAAGVVTAAAVIGDVSLAPPSGVDWAWIWIVVLLPGSTGHLLVAWSHRHVEAWIASLITQGTPVVGSLAAWGLLGESLTLAVVVGGLVVLVSTAVIAVKEGRRGGGPELTSVDPAGG